MELLTTFSDVSVGGEKVFNIPLLTLTTTMSINSEIQRYPRDQSGRVAHGCVLLLVEPEAPFLDIVLSFSAQSLAESDD